MLMEMLKTVRRFYGELYDEFLDTPERTYKDVNSMIIGCRNRHMINNDEAKELLEENRKLYINKMLLMGERVNL